MKWLKILILLIFISSPVFAEQIDINIIIKLESGGNHNAYNKHSRAIGLCQITPIAFKDFKEEAAKGRVDCYFETRYGHYANWIYYLNENDLKNPDTNKFIATYILKCRIPTLLRCYGIPITTENILWAYNAGIDNVVKGRMPRETHNYILRYKNLTNIK